MNKKIFKKKSQKINKSKKVDCLLCNKTFASISSLSHHKKRCKGKDHIEELTDKVHHVPDFDDFNVEYIINNLTQKGYQVNTSNNSQHKVATLL